MFKKKKPEWDKPFSEKIARRVSKLPTGDLEAYIDQSLYEISRNMSAYERGKDLAILEEALLGAEVVHAIVAEIYKRRTSTN